VIIKGCAREAGERTKIAVHSRDRDVDSVGACVGMKGMRVQSIIRELRGEKIDIIEFADDPVVFITHALSPARIARVTIIDPLEKHMEVIVEDTQLSLAIGKKGQNVRLAAKLLGWRVDIKSEEEKRREVASEMVAREVSGAPVAVLLDFGLTAEVVDNLIQAGADSVENVGAMTPEQLVEIPGIQPDTVAAIQIAVNSYFAQFEEAAEEPPEEALERPPEPAAPAPPEEAPETPPEQAAAGAPSPEPAPAGGLPPAPEALPGPEVARETHSFAPADSSVRGESDTIEDAGSSSEQV
jgi:N utilization substance protein A